MIRRTIGPRLSYILDGAAAPGRLMEINMAERLRPLILLVLLCGGTAAAAAPSPSSATDWSYNQSCRRILPPNLHKNMGPSPAFHRPAQHTASYDPVLPAQVNPDCPIYRVGLQQRGTL